MSEASSALNPLFLAFQQALAGRYSIDREIGRGGMGVVYLAREVHLDRLIAIKLLPPERAAVEGLKERFLGEARLAAKLSHPNIIPIHAVEEHDGFVFYVMTFIDGETLSQRVRDRGPLSSTEGARLLREVAWALSYAHAQGLVHRDIKPDNILLERGTNRVLVADFGIAAAAGANTDGVTGTPEFMSPEQVLGLPVDARSDLYSLGATGFFAFSGRFPFEGENPTEILARQVSAPAPVLGAQGLTVPRKLALLIDRCLAKEPDQRPPTAQALAEQLGLALEQRRDVPMALRAFIKRRGRITGAGVILPTVGLLAVEWAMQRWLHTTTGPTVFLLVLAAIVLANFLLSARQLLLAGYDHQDLAPAFRTETDQAREELDSSARPMVTNVTTVLGGISLVSITSSLVLIGIAVSDGTTMSNHGELFWTMLFIAIGVATLSTYSWHALRRQISDIDTEVWGRFWVGPVGKALFGAARGLLGNRKRQVAVTHRATELSLGMAAEQLFASLPKETRRSLGDLPTLLHRLQADARVLRARYDQLQEALGEPQVAVAPGLDDLAAARNDVHTRLGETVASLETIRLNLLRLHAGTATVAGITANLGQARQVSHDVERLIAAQQEIDRFLAGSR